MNNIGNVQTTMLSKVSDAYSKKYKNQLDGKVNQTPGDIYIRTTRYILKDKESNKFVVSESELTEDYMKAQQFENIESAANFAERTIFKVDFCIFFHAVTITNISNFIKF